MNLPPPSAGYDAANESATRQALETADRKNLKMGKNIDMGAAQIILTSPDGTRFYLTVDNAGTLGTTAV